MKSARLSNTLDDAINKIDKDCTAKASDLGIKEILEIVQQTVTWQRIYSEILIRQISNTRSASKTATMPMVPIPHHIPPPATNQSTHSDTTPSKILNKGKMKHKGRPIVAASTDYEDYPLSESHSDQQFSETPASSDPDTREHQSSSDKEIVDLTGPQPKPKSLIKTRRRTTNRNVSIKGGSTTRKVAIKSEKPRRSRPPRNLSEDGQSSDGDTPKGYQSQSSGGESSKTPKGYQSQSSGGESSKTKSSFPINDIRKFVRSVPKNEIKLPPYNKECALEDEEWTQAWKEAFTAPPETNRTTKLVLAESILNGIGIYTTRLREDVTLEIGQAYEGCPPGLEIARVFSKLILKRLEDIEHVSSGISPGSLGYLQDRDGIWTIYHIGASLSTSLLTTLQHEWQFFTSKTLSFIKTLAQDIENLVKRYYQARTNPEKYEEQRRAGKFSIQPSRKRANQMIADQLIHILTLIPTARNIARNKYFRDQRL
jgi:hypothetical protein